ncbi:MAG: hypothetical protein II956_11880 [Bacteroidales bacterium]|nr:hypothetical protein [Bacteroidales bacterium]
MIFRLLILVIILFSTSCDFKLQEKTDICNSDFQKSVLENNDTDNTQNLGFSWFGLVITNDAPVLRTVARIRPVQRHIEKRKTFSYNSLVIISDDNPLKYLAQERLMFCHLKHFGGTLLHFLCKLSL